MSPVERRAVSTGGKWGTITTNRKELYKRVEDQLMDPTFFGVLIAWLPVVMSGFAVYYVGFLARICLAFLSYLCSLYALPSSSIRVCLILLTQIARF